MTRRKVLIKGQLQEMCCYKHSRWIRRVGDDVCGQLKKMGAMETEMGK